MLSCSYSYLWEERNNAFFIRLGLLIFGKKEKKKQDKLLLEIYTQVDTHVSKMQKIVDVGDFPKEKNLDHLNVKLLSVLHFCFTGCIKRSIRNVFNV